MDEHQAPLRRVFNAINGRELLEMVLKELKSQGEGHDELQEHITFPIVEWECTLRVKAYPRSPSEFTADFKGELKEFKETGDAPKENFEPGDLQRPVEVEVKIENIVDDENPPDKAREDHDMAISMPEKVGVHKTVVDKPRIRPRGSHAKGDDES